MPTYRYYISGSISDRFMNYILHDFIDPANGLFLEGQFPTIRRMERSSSETTFLVDIPDIPGFNDPTDYDHYMLVDFASNLSLQRDQWIRADNEQEQ